MTRTPNGAVLVLAAVIAGGCGGAAAPSPAPTTTEAPTLAPTPTATPSPTLAPTPTPAPTPTARAFGISTAAAAYIEQLDGYELTPLPASVERMMTEEFAAGLTREDPMLMEVFYGYSVRTASVDGTAKGMVLAVELEPGWSTLFGSLEGLFAAALGDSTAPLTLADRTVYLDGDADGYQIMYFHDDFLVMVLGPSEKAIKALTEALISANS